MEENLPPPHQSTEVSLAQNTVTAEVWVFNPTPEEDADIPQEGNEDDQSP